MDVDRFVSLAQTLLTTPSRRAVTRGLTALVAGSILTPLFAAETEAAKPRRQKHRDRRGESREQVRDERRKKKKKKKKSPPPTTSGTACPACANPTPVCVNNTCVACTSSSQCPPGTLCDRGKCQACTVCASGCLYPNVQAAVADPAGPALIRVCAGTYTGNLNINRNLTLIGAGNGTGPGDTILHGGNTEGVVDVQAAWTVALRNFRITGGNRSFGNGGGISCFGLVTLTDCTITGNRADAGGGIAIHSSGEAHLTRCTVADNETLPGVGLMWGGGIYNTNTLTLVDSRVTFNRAHAGAGISHSGSTCTLNDTDVDENTASSYGGGMAIEAGSVRLLNDSAITDNHASSAFASGGGIMIREGVLNAAGGSITGNTPDQCVVAAGLGGSGCP